MPSTAVTATLGTIGGLAGLCLVAWPLAIWWEVKKCEKPKYTVLRTLGQPRRDWLGRVRPGAEVRLYAPYLMAEVTMQGAGMDMEKALTGGFRAIAGFIFGKNVAPEGQGSSKVAMTSPVTLEMQQDSAKIAMTSPVTAEMGENNTFKVSFIMPSKYTQETLPKPINSDVHIKEMPARAMVALTWHGRSPREAEVEKRKAELLELMADAGLKPKGSVHCWQFDPPFQWPIFRTNEVLFEVDGSTATS